MILFAYTQTIVRLAFYHFILYLCAVSLLKPIDNEEITTYNDSPFDNIVFCYGSGYYIWYYRCGDG